MFCSCQSSIGTCQIPDIDGQDLGTTSVESYVHDDEHSRLGLLKRWRPRNHLDLPRLLQISFEAILLGRKQHNQRYTKHPTIPKFLSETTTMLLDTSNSLWVDFCRSSKETANKNLESWQELCRCVLKDQGDSMAGSVV